MPHLAFHERATRAPIVNLSAFAKVNLTLEVVGRRTDGYHELRSVVAGIDLADRVAVAISPNRGVLIRCNTPGLATSDNLAVRAAEAFMAHHAINRGVEISLDKAIPVGAGLGGGSSDAAAALLACDALCGTRMSTGDLCQLGAGLGSDVPLFFHLPSACVSGRGERVERVALKWSGWLLIVFAGEFVSTPKVYGAWHPCDSRGHGPSLHDVVEAGDANELNAMLCNDLEPAIFRVSPGVEKVFGQLLDLRVGSFRVSGAGSALYRLFDDWNEAQRTAEIITNHKIGASVSIVRGPVGPSPLNYEEH